MREPEALKYRATIGKAPGLTEMHRRANRRTTMYKYQAQETEGEKNQSRRCQVEVELLARPQAAVGRDSKIRDSHNY